MNEISLTASCPSLSATHTKLSTSRRQALLLVARRHFIAHGYRATTMTDIAAAAGISKRTLYKWHRDKAALFRACILEGARGFPTFDGPASSNPRHVVEDYARALGEHFWAPDTFGMGRLLARESGAFPELLEVVERTHETYLLVPLADALREIGLEAADETKSASLLIAMALAQVHDSFLMGTAPADERSREEHAKRVAVLFVDGAGVR
jgi:TetR/AcrR family transcriptional regulator, mexJK operon transcriptional repressor